MKREGEGLEEQYEQLRERKRERERERDRVIVSRRPHQLYIVVYATKLEQHINIQFLTMREIVVGTNLVQ